MPYKRLHPKIRSISSGTGKDKPPKKPKVKLCKRCNKEVEKPTSIFYVVNKTCSSNCSNKLIEEKDRAKRKKERESIGTNAKMSTLKIQADTAMSNYIRHRDNFICCICQMQGDRSSIDN
jgi:hypothetical protein